MTSSIQEMSLGIGSYIGSVSESARAHPVGPMAYVQEALYAHVWEIGFVAVLLAVAGAAIYTYIIEPARRWRKGYMEKPRGRFVMRLVSGLGAIAVSAAGLLYFASRA